VSGALRHLPNILSSLRLLAVPVLLVLAVTRKEAAFAWLLIAAMLTDIADGWIARTFEFETKVGAFLDSVADSALMFVAVYGIWVFHRDVMTEHALLCGTAVGLWALENVLALVRYGRLSSFHTYLSKVVANVLGIFVGVLFVIGYYPWMLDLTLGLTILSSVEELVLLGMLGEWRTDVRGLWWVLHEKERR
jgi:CDP-diacylglycerol--glycerol-3-phosphate 3-phosphatidyltransferase